MISIDIHRAGRAIPITVQIDDKTVYFKKLMGEHHITSEFIHNSASALDVAIGDYITYPASALWVTASGENYYINQIPSVVKVNSLTFKYNIDFQSNFYNLNKKLFKDGPNGLSDFAYDGSPNDFVAKILSNINEINPTWASGTISSGIDKTLQFTNESCLSALNKIVEAYKMEYDITNKTISLYDTIAGPSGYSFEYGRENGLYKLTRDPVLNQNIVTRCYGFGGQQNIPDTYRNGNKRLIFAASGMGASGYVESTAAQALYGVIEGVYVDDNIFPERTGVIEDVSMNFDGGTIGGVARRDKITRNSATGDCTIQCNGRSETMVWDTDVETTVLNFYADNYYKFGVLVERISVDELVFTAPIAGVDFSAAAIDAWAGSAVNLVANVAGTVGTDFNSETSYIEDTSINFDINSYIIDGQTPSVVFKSGDLSGVQCEIASFDYTTKRIYLKAFTDSDGYIKPNETTMPAIGDTYTLVNIVMPQTYVDTAEVSLQAATQRFLDENCEPHVIYTLDIDPKDAKLNSVSLKAGDRVTIVDSALSINKLIRISSIEYPLVNPYKLKVILANPIVPYTLQDRLVKAASIITKGALFSTSSPVKGMVPGANNAGANYFLNAKGMWAVPTAGTTTILTTGGGSAGVTAHSLLAQLDYASAGHTGFAPIASPALTTMASITHATNPYLRLIKSDSTARSYDVQIINDDFYITDVTTSINPFFIEGGTGKIGLGGVLSPSELLHLGSSTASKVGVRISHSGNAVGFENYISSGSGHTYLDSTIDNSGYNIYFRLRTLGTPVNILTLLGTGNVGIGTTAPIRLFDVRIPYVKTNTSDNYIAGFYSNEVSDPAGLAISLIGAAAQADRVVSFQTTEHTVVSSGTLALQPAGGKVGIGTTTPQQSLHIVGNTPLRLERTGVEKYEFEISNNGTDDVLTITSIDQSKALITFASSGKIGIGTTIPQTKLVVSNAGALGLEIDPTVSTGTEINVLAYNRATMSYRPLNLVGSVITLNDYVGIGGFIAPLSALCINGGLHVGGESAAGDNNILLDGYIRSYTTSYVSQTTGWNISQAGAGDFRYLYADELHAKAFIADLEQALAGGQIICKSVAPLAAIFTIPAAEAAATLVVESFKGFDTFKVFVDGDIIRLRQFNRTGTSLSITNTWGTVVWVSTDTTNKTQTYTFTRSAAPNAGTATAGETIGIGTLALDYGASGNGFLESNAIDGDMAVNSPYHQVVTFTGHPASGLSVRARLGNLEGLAGTGIVPASPGYGLFSDNVYLQGKIVADSGYIGGVTGWAITAGSLIAGSGSTRIELDTTNGIHMGATAFASAPFSVTPAGALKSTSGIIGGWTIGANDLSGTYNGFGISLSALTGIATVYGLHYYNYSQQSTPYSPAAEVLPLYVCLDNASESTFNLPPSGLPGSGSSKMIIINHKYGTLLGAAKYHIQGNGNRIYANGASGTSVDLDEGKAIMMVWEPRGVQGWYVVGNL